MSQSINQELKLRQELLPLGGFVEPPTSAQSRKTGMHTWSQSLLIGHSKEERRQHIALVRAERRQKRLLVVTRDTADAFHRVASLIREMQGVAAPVGRISPPFNHSAFFELVNQHDEATGQNAQMFRQRLLADAAGRVHDAQDAGMRGRQIEDAQALGELRCGMGANLSEQECR